MLDPAFLTTLNARDAEPLSRHTTIGIGGPADAYLAVDTLDQLTGALSLARDADVPVFVLGSGSNIVVGDRGIRGLVIENNTHALSDPQPLRSGQPPAPGPQPPAPDTRYIFRADGGCSFAATSRQLSFAGYAGLEWACGIPGTVGGAVVYNAGAYGGCLADVLQRIAVWDSTQGAVIELAAAALGMVYRGSAFTRGLMAGRAVLWAEFALWQGDFTELRARIAEYDQKRLKAQPRGRNAGSFFKNPGQPAWKLLDATGMRGYQVGGAQFSDKHCNFLINTGNATAADVAALKNEAQRRVRDQFGLELENEVTLVGEGFGDD